MSDKSQILHLWIEKADHDLGTALITYKYIPKYKDTIAFHCQQAVEKYLKAYIIKLGLSLKRTHDLVHLLEMINQKDKVNQSYFEKVFELQDYAVEIRYPENRIELTNEDLNSAICIAKDIRKWILEKLGLNISFDEFKLD